MTLLALGCSGGGGEGVVTGEVFLNKAPLEKGLVRFIPTDPKLHAADAEVKDGKFELRAKAGEYKVEISAPKVVNKKKMYETSDSKEVEQIAELLPPRFNTQSTLKMSVQAGKQEKRFDVESK